MSNESEGPDRPGDIDTIKQLLRRLEEAAVRESETADGVSSLDALIEHAPGHLSTVPPEPDATGIAVSTPLAERPSEPAASAFDVAILAPPPHGELATLQRGHPRASSSIDEVLTAPRTAIIVPDLATAPTVAATTTGGSSRMAIALASFTLGIAAAGAVIVGFDHWRSKSASEFASATSPAIMVPSAASSPATAVEEAKRTPSPTPKAEPNTHSPGDAPPLALTTPAAAATATTSSPAGIGTSVRASAPPAIEPSATMAAATEPAPSPTSAKAATPVGAASASASEPHPSASAPEASATAEAVAKTVEPSPLAGGSERKLHVADQIELRAGQRLQLSLGVAPAPTETERLLVVFRAVPSWLSMSKGSTIGNSIWLLPAHQATDVWLETSDTAATGTADMIVQLARIDGSILAERNVQLRVSSRAPLGSQTIVASSPLEQAVILQLQARGELLLDTGEVEAARTLLRTAAEAGSVAAALRLAETYDPGEVQRLGVTAVSADPTEAVRWYERAEALGSPVAAARLVSLGRR